jgi:uncharacterized membrane protein
VPKARLEAFSDGVIAVIITIMVLEMKVPHGAGLESLAPLWPVFLAYVLSYVYVGIYWNNHHHLMHAVQHIDGSILWANLHLLFWLSLVPFVTGWMSENHFAPLPVAVYGAVLLFAGLAFVLAHRALHARRPERQAFGRDVRGRDPARVRALVDRARALRARGGELVHTRPQDRAGGRALRRPLQSGSSFAFLNPTSTASPLARSSRNSP